MPAQCCDEGVGFGLGHIEAADKAGERRAAAIELEAVGFERVHDAAGHFEEHLVGLDRRERARRPEDRRCPAAIRAASAFDGCARRSHSPFSM